MKEIHFSRCWSDMRMMKNRLVYDINGRTFVINFGFWKHKHPPAGVINNRGKIWGKGATRVTDIFPFTFVLPGWLTDNKFLFTAPPCEGQGKNKGGETSRRLLANTS